MPPRSTRFRRLLRASIGGKSSSDIKLSRPAERPAIAPIRTCWQKTKALRTRPTDALAEHLCRHLIEIGRQPRACGDRFELAAHQLLAFAVVAAPSLECRRHARCRLRIDAVERPNDLRDEAVSRARGIVETKRIADGKGSDKSP